MRRPNNLPTVVIDTFCSDSNLCSSTVTNLQWATSREVIFDGRATTI